MVGTVRTHVKLVLLLNVYLGYIVASNLQNFY